jgi:V8-like Glu-specific endopeptidase
LDRESLRRLIEKEAPVNFRWTCGVLCSFSVCLACSGDLDPDADSASVTVEPIIGGVAATAYPEAAYLNIDMTASGGYACSGTLIAPKVVLTAGHCVDTHKKWEVYVGNAYRASTSAVVYDWNEKGAQTVNPAHHDIALVFLSEPIALAAYPTLMRSKVIDGTAALNVGRVLNGVVQSAAYQGATTLSAADKVGYPYDYYSTTVIQPGDSGGPVFVKGGHAIAAVNSGAGGTTQVLARVDLLADWIGTQIVAHGGAGSTTGGAGAGGASNAGAGGATGASGKGGATPTAGAGGKASATSAAGAGGASSAGGSNAGGKGGAATAGAAGKATAGGAGGATSACLKETEPNDTWATANVVKGAVCSALGTTSDVDWYSVSFAPGSHMIEVASTSDVSFAIGVVSGSSCVTSASGVQRAQVTVGGATQTLCVKASSAAKKTQSYQLNAN